MAKEMIILYLKKLKTYFRLRQSFEQVKMIQKISQ